MYCSQNGLEVMFPKFSWSQNFKAKYFWSQPPRGLYSWKSSISKKFPKFSWKHHEMLWNLVYKLVKVYLKQTEAQNWLRKCFENLLTATRQVLFTICSALDELSESSPKLDKKLKILEEKIRKNKVNQDFSKKAL